MNAKSIIIAEMPKAGLLPYTIISFYVVILSTSRVHVIVLSYFKGIFLSGTFAYINKKNTNWEVTEIGEKGSIAKRYSGLW